MISCVKHVIHVRRGSMSMLELPFRGRFVFALSCAAPIVCNTIEKRAGQGKLPGDHLCPAAVPHFEQPLRCATLLRVAGVGSALVEALYFKASLQVSAADLFKDSPDGPVRP